MRKLSILDRYLEVLYNIEGLDQSLVPVYARALYGRHQAGWRIPTSTYSRCKELLFYKESLGRHSPYYVDLLKIEDRNNLKVVLSDLCHTMRINLH